MRSWCPINRSICPPAWRSAKRTIMDKHPNEQLSSQEKKKDGIEGHIADNVTKCNAVEIPEIFLSRGGGAMLGIDDKFEVNAANDTFDI